jgi:Uncharacterized protein conserved in bacteria
MVGALALAGGMAIAGESNAGPLPPPPELLNDMEFGYAPEYVQPTADSENAARQALEPLEAVQPVAADRPARAPAPIVISPPSAVMPAEYFDLPLEDDAIPGIVMPEIDYSFVEPGREMASGRPRTVGMSIRQLEAWFGLAKGSEGEAVSAKERGDEYVYREQLRKAVRAYMDIVNMADAGNEAREEAWYGVARCEYRLDNWWRAFEALERSFPKTFEKNEIAGRIKLEMYIGERLWRMGSSPAPDAMADGIQLSGYQAASKVYGAAVFNQPTSDDAPLALLRQGDAASMEGRWTDATRYYRQVVQYFPESEPAMQARSSLTESIYRSDHPVGFPEAARRDVASIMDDVERASNRLSEESLERRRRAVTVANDLEAETKLRHAKEYLQSFRVKKSRDAAVFLLGDIVSRYPDTPQAEEAASMLRDMDIEPPMRLSDGTRFPLTAGWAGRDDRTPEGDSEGAVGGSVVLEGQDDAWEGGLPSSPSRETVYEGFFVPGTTE